MKKLLLLITILFSLPSFALTRPQLEALLREKGINLMELEIKGLQVLMGEVTGHINAVPFSKVHILVTDKQAILKNEIDSVDFQGQEILGSVVSVRFNGQYVMKEDVKATIILKQ